MALVILVNPIKWAFFPLNGNTNREKVDSLAALAKF